MVQGEEQEINKIQSAECRMSLDNPEPCVQSLLGSQSDEEVKITLFCVLSNVVPCIYCHHLEN